jgi:hypothetical protein
VSEGGINGIEENRGNMRKYGEIGEIGETGGNRGKIPYSLATALSLLRFWIETTFYIKAILQTPT